MVPKLFTCAVALDGLVKYFFSFQGNIVVV